MLNAWYLVLGRAHSYTEVVRAVIFSVGMYTYTLSGWCSCLLKGFRNRNRVRSVTVFITKKFSILLNSDSNTPIVAC